MYCKEVLLLLFNILLECFLVIVAKNIDVHVELEQFVYSFTDILLTFISCSVILYIFFFVWPCAEIKSIEGQYSRLGCTVVDILLKIRMCRCVLKNSPVRLKKMTFRH